MDGWNTTVSFWDGLFLGAFAVSFREGMLIVLWGYSFHVGSSPGGDTDFYQLLEVPHLTAISPAYKRPRFRNHENESPKVFMGTPEG